TAAAVAAALVLSTAKAALMEGSLKNMLPTKVTFAAALFLALATVGAGAAVLAYQGAAGDSAAPQGQGPGAADAGEPRPAAVDHLGDPLPEGALARMGTTRLRHRPLRTLTTATPADGKLLASCGDEIRLWDAATGKLLREIRDGDRSRSYCALLFAPDGRWLAGAGRDSV